MPRRSNTSACLKCYHSTKSYNQADLNNYVQQRNNYSSLTSIIAPPQRMRGFKTTVMTALNSSAQVGWGANKHYLRKELFIWTMLLLWKFGSIKGKCEPGTKFACTCSCLAVSSVQDCSSIFVLRLLKWISLNMAAHFTGRSLRD